MVHTVALMVEALVTSLKVEASSPDEVIEFFSIYLNLSLAVWPWGLLIP
jgi:hypothetical protein